ncbi:MAG: hypothetical protein JWP49_1278 [Phenylobacterium sp.]|jgi:hypothetical protein|nr:hypothetical protein [Phenylobacterium sp.]
MNLEFTEDQAVLVSSVENILDKYAELPTANRRDYHYYARDLDQALVANGFLDAVSSMGSLEAVLVVEAVSKIAPVVEIATSTLVAPHISAEELPRPLAIVSGDLSQAQRYLSVAKAALLDTGDDILLIDIRPGDVEAVDTIFAYPFGRFTTAPDLSKARSLGAAAVGPFRQWRQVALAAEAIGAMRSAVDFTVDYVKQRQMFGHALGLFQAVQHRLAQCHQATCAAQYLTYRAGWSGDPLDAVLAATYAQSHMPKLWFDLHQFNGAMGVTNEHKLHFWTYRLRALQSEMGGANEGALQAAERVWGKVA